MSTLAPMFRPGEMDKRVSIIRESRTDDGMGGSTVSETTVDTVWCHVRPRSGSEQDFADRVNGQALYLFVIRYRSDILESDRIRWEGVDYNIRFISDKGPRNLYLEIDAERGVGQ